MRMLAYLTLTLIKSKHVKKIELQFQIPYSIPSFFSAFQNRFKLPSECTIYRPCFKGFSAFSNCFIYHRNASFTFLVLIFSGVPNRFKYRHNACFRNIISIYFSPYPNRFKYCQNVWKYKGLYIIIISWIENGSF